MKRLQNIAQQLPAQLSDILSPRVKGSARIENSSFFRIPSVNHFNIISGAENQILKGTGLDRRLPKEVEFDIHEDNNKHNKYMKFKIRSMKLALSAGNVDEYGRLVNGEMKHSTAFRVSAFNTVLRGGYKDRPIQSIFQILNGVNVILKQQYTALKYFRVEIPKGTPQEIVEFFKENPEKLGPGKMRPLGVPTAPGRVVLHMGNGFLTLMLENELKTFNHAFMPLVGTNTALEQFAVEIPKSPFVYEFDIKGYFQNVHIVDVIKELAKRGMPFTTLRRLFLILVKSPKNMSYFDDQSEDDLLLNSREGYKKGIDRVITIFEESYLDSKFKLNIFEEKIEEYFGYSVMGGKVDQSLRGLPQGAAPSTILALIVIAEGAHDLFKKGIKLLMYADDGLLHSEKPFTPEAPPGFEFALEKSGGVRQENQTIKEEVKFLGLKYNFKTNLFKGATRTGSELEFGPDQLDVIKLVSRNLDHSYSSMMEALVKSGIGGLVLAKLYGGKFGKLDQTVRRTYLSDSYGGKFHNIVGLSKDPKLQRIASTISCDGLILQIEKSKGKKGKAGLKSEMRKGRSSERLRIQLQDLRAALAGEDSLDKGIDHYLEYPRN